ncbi:hypothetical protein JCM9957A_51390 [Kineosporia succinea]
MVDVVVAAAGASPEERFTAVAAVADAVRTTAAAATRAVRRAVRGWVRGWVRRWVRGGMVAERRGAGGPFR